MGSVLEVAPQIRSASWRAQNMGNEKMIELTDDPLSTEAEFLKRVGKICIRIRSRAHSGQKYDK